MPLPNKARPISISNDPYPVEEALTQDHYNLMSAVEEEKFDEVSRILSSAINPNFLIEEESLEFVSPLTIAVCKLNVQITQTLLEHKANPNIKPINTERDVFLMLPEEDVTNCNESNEKCFYVYRTDKIFLQMKDKQHELDTDALLPLLKEEKFDQPKINPKKCLNKELCNAILEIAAIKGLVPFNRSLVEVLMLGVSKLEQSFTSRVVKRPLKLFGIETPFKVKVILTPEKIQDAHKILDLLLCYGLKDFVWTEIFDKSIKQLAEALEYVSISVKQKAMIPMILDQEMKAGIKRTLLSGVVKGLIWLSDRHKSSSPHNTFVPYATSVVSIKRTAQMAADEIDKEKQQLLNEYRTKIAEGSTILPVALIDIIIHYAISSFTLCQNTVVKRQTENRMVQFWINPENDNIKMEKDANNQAQYFNYECATRHLENLIGKNARQILIEYLVDEPGCTSDRTLCANQKKQTPNYS